MDLFEIVPQGEKYHKRSAGSIYIRNKFLMPGIYGNLFKKCISLKFYHKVPLPPPTGREVFLLVLRDQGSKRGHFYSVLILCNIYNYTQFYPYLPKLFRVWSLQSYPAASCEALYFFCLNSWRKIEKVSMDCPSHIVDTTPQKQFNRFCSNLVGWLFSLCS